MAARQRQVTCIIGTGQLVGALCGLAVDRQQQASEQAWAGVRRTAAAWWQPTCGTHNPCMHVHFAGKLPIQPHRSMTAMLAYVMTATATVMAPPPSSPSPAYARGNASMPAPRIALVRLTLRRRDATKTCCQRSGTPACNRTAATAGWHAGKPAISACIHCYATQLTWCPTASSACIEQAAPQRLQWRAASRRRAAPLPPPLDRPSLLRAACRVRCHMLHAAAAARVCAAEAPPACGTGGWGAW